MSYAELCSTTPAISAVQDFSKGVACGKRDNRWTEVMSAAQRLMRYFEGFTTRLQEPCPRRQMQASSPGLSPSLTKHRRTQMISRASVSSTSEQELSWIGILWPRWVTRWWPIRVSITLNVEHLDAEPMCPHFRPASGSSGAPWRLGPAVQLQ